MPKRTGKRRSKNKSRTAASAAAATTHDIDVIMARVEERRAEELAKVGPVERDVPADATLEEKMMSDADAHAISVPLEGYKRFFNRLHPSHRRVRVPLAKGDLGVLPDGAIVLDKNASEATDALAVSFCFRNYGHGRNAHDWVTRRQNVGSDRSVLVADRMTRELLDTRSHTFHATDEGIVAVDVGPPLETRAVQPVRRCNVLTCTGSGPRVVRHRCCGCRVAWYCSVDHAKVDWLSHRDVCTVYAGKTMPPVIDFTVCKPYTGPPTKPQLLPEHDNAPPPTYDDAVQDMDTQGGGGGGGGDDE